MENFIETLEKLEQVKSNMESVSILNGMLLRYNAKMFKNLAEGNLNSLEKFIKVQSEIADEYEAKLIQAKNILYEVKNVNIDGERFIYI